ncbi:putative phage replication protein [Acinetobacter pittii]|nr:putative phage replication protein [Acinetobacter pittii]
MNKFEILAWGLLISFFTAGISGAVVLWWLARKKLYEKGASHE